MENTIKIQDVEFEKVVTFSEPEISFYFQKDLIPKKDEFLSFAASELEELSDEYNRLVIIDILTDNSSTGKELFDLETSYPLVIVKGGKIIAQKNLLFNPIEYVAFFDKLKIISNREHVITYKEGVNCSELNDSFEDPIAFACWHDFKNTINFFQAKDCLMLQFYISDADSFVKHNLCLTIKNSDVKLEISETESFYFLTYLEVNKSYEFFIFNGVDGYGKLEPFNNGNKINVNLGEVVVLTNHITRSIEEFSESVNSEDRNTFIEFVLNEDYPSAENQEIFNIFSCQTLNFNYTHFKTEKYCFMKDDYHGQDDNYISHSDILMLEDEIIVLPNNYSIREINENYITMQTSRQGSKIPTYIYLLNSNVGKYFDSVSSLDKFIENFKLGIDETFKTTNVSNNVEEKISEDVANNIEKIITRKTKTPKKRVKFDEQDF